MGLTIPIPPRLQGRENKLLRMGEQAAYPGIARKQIASSNGAVVLQVVPRHNWSGQTIHGRFGCHRWSSRTIYGCHKWSTLPQVKPPFILLQVPNTSSLATCSLPFTIYMAKWMLHGLSKHLNGRQLEATHLNERQFSIACIIIIINFTS